MDISLLAQSLTNYIVPFLPYLLKIGEGAAGETGKKLASGAWDGAKAVWAKLLPKVEARSSAMEAAKDAAQAPDNTDFQAAFRVQLNKLLNEDQAFATEIDKLLAQVKATGTHHVMADRGSVAFGDNAQGNITITGGIGGDFLKGDKHKS
jgi:hypothetical protein